MIAAMSMLLTPDGAAALAQELERLRHERDVEFAARLSEIRAFGELGSNDDYLQIKEEEAVVDARVRQLESVLNAARVIDGAQGSGDLVEIGSRVEVENLASGDVRTHELAGGFEQLGPGQISANSPVGQALLGRRAGDAVTVELPTGRSVRLRVLGIQR